MALEALEWGMGCPFACKGHDLAAQSVPLYVGRKWGRKGRRLRSWRRVAACLQLVAAAML